MQGTSNEPYLYLGLIGVECIVFFLKGGGIARKTIFQMSFDDSKDIRTCWYVMVTHLWLRLDKLNHNEV